MSTVAYPVALPTVFVEVTYPYCDRCDDEGVVEHHGGYVECPACADWPRIACLACVGTEIDFTVGCEQCANGWLWDNDTEALAMVAFSYTEGQQ